MADDRDTIPPRVSLGSVASGQGDTEDVVQTLAGPDRGEVRPGAPTTAVPAGTSDGGPADSDVLGPGGRSTVPDAGPVGGTSPGFGPDLGPEGSGRARTGDRSAGGDVAAAKSTRAGDAIFRGTSVSAGTTVLIIMAAIAAFLVYRAIPALRENDVNFFTTQDWFPDPSEPGGPNVFGIAALTFHTVVTSVIAMILAVPVAIGIALFITFYAPRRLAQGLGYLVDLLAAVPSIVYGLWGAFFLAPNLQGVSQLLDQYLGWIPLFNYRPDSIPANRSDLTAGIVLAIMILPIVSAITREVFTQVPTTQVEGALALGATRWEMIRMSVFPFGRPGMVSAAILGLGRALGETLAVTLILATAYNVNVHILEDGGVTFASNIALKYNEAGAVGTGALIASGLVLFVITLAVNTLSQIIVRRKQVA